MKKKKKLHPDRENEKKKKYLVLVPRVQLHERPVDHLRARRVDDRRPVVQDVVARDQGPPLEAQQPLEGPLLGSRLERRVDLLGGRLPRDLEDGVGDRGVEQGDPDREPVELSLELREHQGDGLGGPRRRRGQVAQGRARAAEVGLLRVERVDDGLRVGHVVDGRDAPSLDPEVFEHDFDQRSEAVRGAGGRRDDGVVGILELAVVDPEHAVEDGPLLVVDRRRDDDGLGAVVQEGLEGGAGEELAGALEDQVDAVERDLGTGKRTGTRKEERESKGLRGTTSSRGPRAKQRSTNERGKKNSSSYLGRRLRPGKLEGRLLPSRRRHRERLPILSDRSVPEPAQRRVELEEVGRGLGDGQGVVDGNNVDGREVDTAETERTPESQASDPAKAVDEGARAFRLCHFCFAIQELQGPLCRSSGLMGQESSRRRPDSA